MNFVLKHSRYPCAFVFLKLTLGYDFLVEEIQWFIGTIAFRWILLKSFNWTFLIAVSFSHHKTFQPGNGRTVLKGKYANTMYPYKNNPLNSKATVHTAQLLRNACNLFLRPQNRFNVSYELRMIKSFEVNRGDYIGRLEWIRVIFTWNLQFTPAETLCGFKRLKLFEKSNLYAYIAILNIKMAVYDKLFIR